MDYWVDTPPDRHKPQPNSAKQCHKKILHFDLSQKAEKRSSPARFWTFCLYWVKGPCTLFSYCCQSFAIWLFNNASTTLPCGVIFGFINSKKYIFWATDDNQKRCKVSVSQAIFIFSNFMTEVRFYWNFVAKSMICVQLTFVCEKRCVFEGVNMYV